jgi:hypothetical protein
VRKAHLICLLLLSARMHNLLPNNPLRLEQLIGPMDAVDLSAFAPAAQDRRSTRRKSEVIRDFGPQQQSVVSLIWVCFVK